MATKQCEELFARVNDNLTNDRVLPRVGIGIVQQCLSPGDHHTTLPKVLADRLEQIQKREISVIVAGEISAGKSTFLNILMGGQYLPVSFCETTKVLCELRYHPTDRKAFVHFVDEFTENVEVPLPCDSNAETWQQIRDCIKNRKYASCLVRRLVITWPLDIVQKIFVSEPPVSDGTNTARHTPSSTETTETTTDFDPIFEDAMRKQYADSFHEQAKESFDVNEHQTYRKEVYTSDSSKQPTNDDQTYPKTSHRSMDKQFEQHDSSMDRTRQQNNDKKYQKEENDILTKDNQNHQNKETTLHYSAVEPSRIQTHQEVTERDTTNGAPRVRPFTQELASDSASSTSSLLYSSCQSLQQENEDNFKVALLDCPGIKDRTHQETFKPTLDNAVSSRAFIFLIGTHSVEGLQALMEDIEAILKDHEVELNPDCSLFIINKIDIPTDDELDDLNRHVVERLRAKWPLISKNNIVNMETRKILKDVSKGNMESRNTVYEIINEFLQTSVRISLEEHCLWLLNFLETAHAFASTGKKWVGIQESRKKLEETLTEVHTNAVDLHMKVSKCRENDIHKGTLNKLREIISEAAEDVTSIDWCVGEIEDRIKNDNIEWSEIDKQIDRMIIDKLNNSREKQMTELAKEHNKRVGERFKTECDNLEKIENMLYGIIPTDLPNDGSGASGYLSMLLPAAIGAAIRAAPVIFPFVFLAVPIIPIPLIVASLAEEIKHHKNTTKREEFKRDKGEYVKMRTRELCESVTKIIDNSEIFRYIFGESKKQGLHKRIEELLELVKYLRNCSLEDTVEHKRVCCRHIIETIDVYTKHVLNHNIERSDLSWQRSTEGNRRKIGGGGQGNVYEAKLRGEFKDVAVAVKEFHCSYIQMSPEESLPSYLESYREYFTLRQLSRKNSTNVVKFYGTNLICEEDSLKFRLVLERCFENLSWLIREEASSQEDVARAEFFHHAAECTAGLRFLHDNNVLHRDIKPENYLVREKLQRGRYRIVICDMGCSKLSYQICTPGVEVGTIAYCAPELRRPHAVHTKRSDVYSLGLVLWELAFHRHIPERSQRLSVPRSREMPRHKGMVDVISACLKNDPKARKTASELAQLIEQCTLAGAR